MRFKKHLMTSCELRFVAFISISATVIFLNLQTLPDVIARKSFFSIAPQYGSALDKFYEAEKKNKSAHDRNWYAYYLVEQNFFGWTLVATDKAASYFSRMYNFNFGGLAATRIESREYKLSLSEVTKLLNRPYWQGVIGRYGRLIIVLPEPDMIPGDLLMLQHRDIVFMVPAAYLARRLSTNR